MKPTFDSTVKILVEAYLKGTLHHANCSACAVGNIVAHANGVEPVLSFSGDGWKFSDGSKVLWQKVFCSEQPRHQLQCPQEYFGEVKQQIDSTGYTWQELAAIELAFESVSDRVGMAFQTDDYKDQLMFKGLMKVVDVLAEIHGIDLSTKETAKKLFVKS